MSDLVLLGVDPGLRYTGFAVAAVDTQRRTIDRVITLGTMQTLPSRERTVRKTSDHLRRAQEHAEHLLHLVDKYAVRAIAMELTTLVPHKIPTLSFGIMTGIVATLQRPIIEVLPHEVKRIASGATRGPKRDVIAWALTKTKRQRNLPWPTSTRRNELDLLYSGKHVALEAEHPADALAAIEAALKTPQFDLSVSILGAGIPKS